MIRSLRTKLLLSVGVILFVVAVISYFLPIALIQNDLDKANLKINQFFQFRTPEEKEKLTAFFATVRDGLTQKVSSALLSTVILSLGVALILLARISKRITRPITQLALASEEISHGRYDNVELPHIEKRDDEVAVLVGSFENMVVGLREREKIRGVLNKVVSKEVAGQLLKSQVELGGEERVVTMLFSDIRGFTHLSEGISPKELIGHLNAYMTRMCKVIDACGGVVDKFVGDEIMALYGAPLPQENQAEKAVETALLMREELKKWNVLLKQEGKLTFEIGMGIHTGLVLAGNMGAQDRLNYTVIGANVNLAARLCSSAKPGQILVSAETMKACGGQFHFKPEAPLHLKGIDDAVIAYDVIGDF